MAFQDWGFQFGAFQILTEGEAGSSGIRENFKNVSPRISYEAPAIKTRRKSVNDDDEVIILIT